MPTTAPPALTPGCRIAVVAPAGAFEAADLEAGLTRLRARYEVVHEPDIFARSGYLAGSDARRFGELVKALEDPRVRAILPARGGYGATRLLEALPAETVARHPKLLIGFSDITALHVLWVRAGLRSLHASMALKLGTISEAAWARWVRTVEGILPAPVGGLISLTAGRAEGPLVGGNLAVLAALCGTPYAPPLDGAVLFLEDIGERPYRVDRMLTTLRQAGWFARVRGVLIGQLTDCHPGPDGRTIDEVIADRLGDLPIPVLAGLPSGHEADNQELPLGARTRIDAASREVTFLEHAVTPAR